MKECKVSDISIFFSYAREDEHLVTELKKHLQPLKTQGLISAWYDDNTISAGLEWQQVRSHQLDTASIIALLISPDFLASDYTYAEMQRAMQRHVAGEARVIPILLKPANWENTPFAGLRPLPTNAQPVTRWPDPNEAFLNISRAMHEVINDLQAKFSKQHNGTMSASVKDEPSIRKAKDTQSERGLGATILIYDVHARWVSTVAWSPDGRRLTSGSGDGTVRIWSSETGQNFLTYRRHSDVFFSRIWDAQWSPDGRFIASCGLGVTVHIWDAQTSKDLVLYNHHMLTSFMTDTLTLSWSPDGSSIASATGGLTDIDQTVHVWNAATGQTQLKYAGHAGGVLDIFTISSVAWSPNGQYIASAGTDKTMKKQKSGPSTPSTRSHTAQIWHANTGQYIATCNGSSHYIYDIAWSPDSRYITTAETEGGVYIWDARSGENVLVYRGHTKAARAVAWSPDGSRIASAGNDHTVQIWHATTGKLLYMYREHTRNVTTVAWSPDGKRIASSGSDGIVRIWQAV